MLISFDPLAKAIYITLEKGKAKRTIEFAPESFIDLDSKGNLMGIELLHPGTLILKKIAKEYRKPELRRIHTQPLQRVYYWLR